MNCNTWDEVYAAGIRFHPPESNSSERCHAFPLPRSLIFRKFSEQVPFREAWHPCDDFKNRI